MFKSLGKKIRAFAHRDIVQLQKKLLKEMEEQKQQTRETVQQENKELEALRTCLEEIREENRVRLEQIREEYNGRLEQLEKENNNRLEQLGEENKNLQDQAGKKIEARLERLGEENKTLLEQLRKENADQLEQIREENKVQLRRVKKANTVQLEQFREENREQWERFSADHSAQWEQARKSRKKLNLKVESIEKTLSLERESVALMQGNIAELSDLIVTPQDLHSHHTYGKVKFGEISIEKLLRDYTFDTVLDIGCGEGKHSDLFLDAGKDVTAIDYGESPYFLKNKSRIKAIVADFNNYEFDRQFDCV